MTILAEDSLIDLFNMIDIWSDLKLDSVEISLVDLRLMKQHIEDLEELE